MREIGIKVGQIYRVTNDFWSSGKFDNLAELRVSKSIRRVRIRILKGEFIEIRFPYEWHCRTEDDCYFHCLEEDILKNCEYFGFIKPEIKFGNKHNLKQILDENLFDGFWVANDNPELLEV